MQVRFVRLGEVDNTLIVGEQLGLQLGVLIEFQALDHQPVKVAHQEVSQVEGTGFIGRECLKPVLGGIEAVTVRPGQSVNTPPLQHGIQTAAGSAVTVGDEQLIVVGLVLLNQVIHRVGYALGSVV